MRVTATSVSVDDQDKALHFYTGVLGFVKKTEIPLGEHRWLTVVSPDDGIPFTAFTVDDVRAEHDRLRSQGVRFTQEPLDAGGVTMAVFDDTCGNLLQIVSTTQAG